MINAMVAGTNTRTRGLPLLVGPIAFLVTLAACGGSSRDAATEIATTTSTAPEPTNTISTSTTVTPTTSSTTSPSTTSSTSTSTTTTTTTTTSTTSTVPAQQTKPIAPPSDPRANEPVIEMGTLSIPKIGVEMTMYEGIRLTTLDYGPGHWPGTALPGQIGNVVVGGHRTSKHRIFRKVDQLVAGDEIIFHDANGTHVYLVNRVEIVDPTDIWIIDPTETATVTLFACHPPGSTAQRIVVFADLKPV
jgi:sortase A